MNPLPRLTRLFCLALVWKLFAPPAVNGAEVDVYLLGGQSNMNGAARVVDLPHDIPRLVANAFYHFGSTWVELDYDKTRTSWTKGRFGPELGLALELATPQRPAYIAKYAANGMALHHGWHGGRWDGGKPAPQRRNFYPGENLGDPNQGQLYRGMLRKFQAAIEGLKQQGHHPVVRGFIWMQGEQDSKHELSATSYAENLQQLRRRLREDLVLESELPILFGQVLPHVPGAVQFTHRDAIREQMVKAGRLPMSKMISTDGFGLAEDAVHYDAEGQLRLGRQFAKALMGLSRAGSARQDPSSPRVDVEGSQKLPSVTTITGFFSAYCLRCHNAEEHRGGINLSEMTDFHLDNAKHWQDILDNVQRGDMPPNEMVQPSEDERRWFLSRLRQGLDRLDADTGERDFRFTRLTNNQIAWSLRDLLGIDRDFSGELIEDPVGKHGQSLQSELELTSGHMELYLKVLRKAVGLAIPDLSDPPTPYGLHGNDWEKQHYLNRNDLAHGARRKHRRYRGPQWLDDEFEVPLPPNHFFRIYIDDNRAEGQFRVRLFIRNQPPKNGGDLQQHEVSLFFDKGFKSPMHTIGNVTLEAKPETQVFEIFGNVYDFPGVDPAPLAEGEDPYGVMAHFKYRFLTVQNCSPLRSPSDKPVNNREWVIHSDAHFIRADDRWIDAWGEDFGQTNWLKRSHGGSDHPTRGKPAVYKDVMKDTSYAVIERIEFDMPWQWPPASVEPFLKDGRLHTETIASEIKNFARRAWRRSLTEDESRQLDSLIATELQNAESKADALRQLLVTVLADTRFLFYSDVEDNQKLQNRELVARLAGFLWRSVPDKRLATLSNRDEPISDQELIEQVQRMIADPRSDRFVEAFAASWMSFAKINQIAINPNYYQQWNPKFKEYMKQESIAFLETLLREDLSCLNCLSSDFVVVNDIMAKYYGMPAPQSGHRFSRVPAPEHRGGVLTQAAFLLGHSDGEDAHAVNRGVWLRSRLLGDPPRDPPPEVPALADVEGKSPEAAGLSTKDRLSLHRTGICYDCHRDIDPWGVAMEAFDATGLTRNRILRLTPDQDVKRRFHPVDDQAEVRGIKVAGMDQLRDLLLTQYAEQFGRAFSHSMLSFALGRPLGYREDEAVDSLADHFKKQDYRMADLIKAIVLRPEFRHPNSGSPAS